MDELDELNYEKNYYDALDAQHDNEPESYEPTAREEAWADIREETMQSVCEQWGNN